VFWLDMGSPLSIGVLAERLFGAIAPEAPPRVEIIGLRPGEKLREELTTQGLSMRPTSHARILSARQPQVERQAVRTALGSLRLACARGDASAALAALESGTGDYQPSEAARAAAREATAAALRSRAATVRLPRAS
jgi:FlaA1/EpsC-like NDP-sugar epimerase